MHGKQICIQELTKKRDAFKQKLDDNKDFWKFGLDPYWVGSIT